VTVRPAPLTRSGALTLVCVAASCVSEVAPPRPTSSSPAVIEPETPRRPGDPAACDPGEKTLQRLNRSEYDRTVKDLLGVTATPALSTFPPDDVARGFDNNADVLSTSPLLTEKLADAALDVSAELFARASESSLQVVEAESLSGSVGGASGDRWNLWSAGELSASFDVAAAGRHRVVVVAEEQAAGPDAARMQVSVDGVVLGTVEVTDWEAHAFEVELTVGAHSVTARFENDFYNPAAGEDRNLLIDSFLLEGPLDVGPPGPGLALVPCDAAATGVTACAEQTLLPLLTRAFRRPVTSEEVAGYVELVEGVVADGDAFEDGLALAIEAILLSPSFLFRVELDDGDDVHRLNPHELATRLSYFLWGTMPDDVLFAAAADGTLARPDVFAAEVNRMLASPKAHDGIAAVLAGQWLDSRSVNDASPDPSRYPLPPEVRAAMKTETQLVVQALLDADRPAKDILDVDFTYLNAALSAHYGIALPADAPDDDGDGFVRVSLAGTNRAGVLTHGAILAGHSYPFRTSPVKRGRFVVDALLCIPPGDIPPDVPPLPEEATGSVRERMEQHRADPSCAACHAMMDPIGFGLETFDPAGRSRTHDGDGFVIDDDDVFFDIAFDGPRGLAAALKQQETLDFCMIERIGTYALGRGLDSIVEGDSCTIRDVIARHTEAGASFRDILLAIAQSDAFQMRRASPGPAPSTPTTEDP
jgi:hypothetical protein